MTELVKSAFDVKHLQELAKNVLSLATKMGATESEVGISANKGFSVGVHDGDVEKVEYNQDKVIEISVSFGKKSGSASISDMRPEAIKAAVEAACHIAKFTGEDPFSGLADKSELAFDYPHLALADEWAITVPEAIDLACDCERQARAIDKRIMSAEEVSVATTKAVSLYANSNGFVGHFAHTRHEIGCILVAKSGDEMQRDYSYTVSSDPKRLASVASLAQEAAYNTVQRLGARRISTRKAPVIFAAQEARSLIGHFVSAMSGGSIYRKSSFLLDKVGQQVFSDLVHIQEFPHLAHALGSSPFDDDGVATRSNIFVENGVLTQYALGVYSARKLGLKTTGNAGGVHNLVIQPGNKNLAALLQEMGTGLLVTELMGQGVNLITGDYSRGVGGFWVENGEIQYPVHEITIAGTLQNMYANIAAVGDDVDERGNIRTGSILINEIQIAGE